MKKDRPPTRLIVDMREQNSHVTTYIEQLKWITIEYAALNAGDYVLSPSAVCERKEAEDFVQSIMGRRLFNQIPKMKSEYETIVILIEGDIFKSRSAIEPSALMGALSWLTVLEGISVVYTNSQEMTSNLIATMARHVQHGLGYTIALRTGKPKDNDTIAQYLIEGLPAVGGAKAQDLLRHFTTPLAVFNASIAEICEVKGISKQTAQKIYDASRVQWSGVKR